MTASEYSMKRRQNKASSFRPNIRSGEGNTGKSMPTKRFAESSQSRNEIMHIQNRSLNEGNSKLFNATDGAAYADQDTSTTA